MVDAREGGSKEDVPGRSMVASTTRWGPKEIHSITEMSHWEGTIIEQAIDRGGKIPNAQ
jgi:hypothetical protein